MSEYDENSSNTEEQEPQPTVIDQQTFSFSQESVNYKITTVILDGRIDIAVLDSSREDHPLFEDNFSLGELKKIHPIFKAANRIEEGKFLLDSAIQKKKIDLDHDNENSIDIIFHTTVFYKESQFKINLPKRKFSCSTDDDKIDEIERKKADLAKAQGGLKTQLFNTKFDLENNIKTNERLRTKMKLFDKESMKIQDENDEIQKKIEDLKNNNDRLRIKINDLKAKQEKLKKKLEKTKKKMPTEEKDNLKASIRKSQFPKDENERPRKSQLPDDESERSTNKKPQCPQEASEKGRKKKPAHNDPFAPSDEGGLYQNSEENSNENENNFNNNYNKNNNNNNNNYEDFYNNTNSNKSNTNNYTNSSKNNNSEAESSEEDKVHSEMSSSDSKENVLIKTDEEMSMLTKKISNMENKIKLEIVFKATNMSDKAKDFHNICDELNGSVIVFLTDNNFRFGGYTKQSWKGKGKKNDLDAFFFILDKDLVSFNVDKGKSAITCDPKSGPIFSEGLINIPDNFFCNGGSTIEKYQGIEDYELVGGEKNFNVYDMEVYRIINI